MYVLVVDDDAPFREILQRMLENDHDVRKAESGSKALLMMEQERPSLVLLDIQMPEMDGIQVLKAMQKDPRLATVPVIVISAFDDTEWKVRGIEAGANDYMVKPIVKAELLARVAVQFRRLSSSPAPTAQGRAESPSPCDSEGLLDGRYLIKGVLGRGGVGTVYEATQVKLGRPVAIKVLNVGRHRPKRAKRLEQEAQIVAALGHAHICQVHDMGRLEDGSPYVVMEKLEGRSLAKRLNEEGPLPFPDIMLIMNSMLSALHAAHLNSVIHRDIKPANVFLAKDAGGKLSVKVLDFGMAKLLWSSETEPDIMLGTPIYMAPEQILNYRITPAVDIYSSSLVLFEMVTGERPLHATSLHEASEKITKGVWPDPRKMRSDVPDFIVDAIDKARARKPELRFESAEAFRVALRKGAKALAQSGGRSDARPWWRKLV
jgi:eukaryotic-like serine/threonine-protein kinase